MKDKFIEMGHYFILFNKSIEFYGYGVGTIFEVDLVTPSTVFLHSLNDSETLTINRNLFNSNFIEVVDPRLPNINISSGEKRQKIQYGSILKVSGLTSDCEEEIDTVMLVNNHTAGTEFPCMALDMSTFEILCEFRSINEFKKKIKILEIVKERIGV